MFVLSVSSAWALIGTPCDPENDFSDTFLIRNWKKIPHVNQEESEQRVKEINAKNIDNLHWTYKPKANTPIYTCLTYAAAAIANWWSIEFGQKLPEYKSFNNGRMEKGYNPRKFELMYKKRSKWHKIRYLMVSKCPITGWKVPIRPKGFSRILTDKSINDTIIDPIDDITYSYKSTDYPMEKKWLAVVSHHWKGAKNAPKLKKALRNFGPLFVQFEILKKKYSLGTHAVVCIGYGTLPNGKTAFICHDSFGKNPKEYKQDAFGAPSYRYVFADELDEAIAFPHTPVVKASMKANKLQVSIFNKGGKPVASRRIFYINRSGKVAKMKIIGRNKAIAIDAKIVKGKAKVYVEADYYMSNKGKGRWFNIPVKK